MKKRESIRYIENAKEILRKSPVEDNYYTDIKYVKTALGCVYLGVLKAIDEFLLSKGVERYKLPKKVEEYEKSLKRYGGVYNGKLMRQFETIYHELHIAGYYRGDLQRISIVKEAIANAKDFIEKIAGLTKER
jgi:hypothetical protein